MIKVLIVEDSRVVSEYLEYILSSDPQIQVIGNVSNGQKALDFIGKNKPDVITMDIEMPIMNGLEATRIIMSTTPLPILIVTASRNSKAISTSIECFAAGALAFIEKPLGINHPKEKEQANKLINLVKVMSEVKVIRRKPIKALQPSSLTQRITPDITQLGLSHNNIVAIGVSSGGPPILHTIFSKITEKFPYPILVVQHIAPGFLKGLVKWLAETTKIPINIASDNEIMMPGNIYFAPDHLQMGVSSSGMIKLVKPEAESRIVPSVAHLFSSVAKEFGRYAIGIILTGMGSDGSKELMLMQDRGALTIAQDKESSLIWGMPGEAIKFGAAKLIQSADEISDLLADIELNIVKK
jgi:two-component system chemotaxis response regulator CheB